MEMNTKKVKRGEIYYYDFGSNEGSIQSGVRPVLVVQCEEGNNFSTTTVVAAITTAIKKRYLPSHIYLGTECGLREPSMVMLEQIKTVNQGDLERRIGCVSDPATLKIINNGLKKALGLWYNKPRDEANVRCLCKQHLDEYMQDKDLMIRRFDIFDRTKHRCDKCDAMGYEYTVTEKSRSGSAANGK